MVMRDVVWAVAVSLAVFAGRAVPAQEAPATARALSRAAPEAAGFAPGLRGELQAILEAAVSEGRAPGAVLVVGRDGRVVVELAVGDRSRVPAVEPMAADAVFDLASLTKCVATATCVMKLVEDGRLALQDRVATHLPGFGRNGKEAITVEQLLRHRGGLLPDNALADYEGGPEAARRRIFELGLRAPPGERYIYTDVGFIVLGWVVEEILGRPLDACAQDLVFGPLGMRDTRFVRVGEGPGEELAGRAVPTEPAAAGGAPLRGVVHDPRARLLGGVAGHAGLFSTAGDLARYCAALLAGGGPVLSRATVRRMTAAPGLPAGERRGLGWDLRARDRGAGGRHFPADSFGHTGFTGTSLWMDPRTRTFVVLLTSRLHPGGKGGVGPLRAQVATTVARALRERPWPLRGAPEEDEPVRTGLDRVAGGHWPRRLEARRVGLITNHTGRDRHGRRGIDLLHGRKDLELAAVFSPEHGLEGTAESKVADAEDQATGLPVFSLYGRTRRPTDRMLRGVDALVFDIQDIGTRFYTYVSTMVLAMEEAARRDFPFVVLDRPNPIGGVAVEGPVADADALDFVGILRVPVRHGMTAGELALLAREERGLELDLEVVWMTGWRRGELWDETGLPWVNPSPNMRSLEAALLYPGVGLLETTNLSVGRGTPAPFEHMGAPWLDGKRLAAALGARGLPGIAFEPYVFTPDASRFAGERCSGVRFRIRDRRALEPVRLGIELAAALSRLHPEGWSTERLNRLLKHRATLEAVRAGRAADAIAASWAADLERFRERRRRFLLYDE